MKLDIDSVNKRIDITGDPENWVIVMDDGRAITLNLVKNITKLNPNAFYKFAHTPGGINMESFYAEPKKELWN